MATIAGEIERGEFAWNLDDEDVHLNIEKRLTRWWATRENDCTPAAACNDQVATDIRLWLRDAIDRIVGLIAEFQPACSRSPKHHADTVAARLHPPAGRAAWSPSATT